MVDISSQDPDNEDLVNTLIKAAREGEPGRVVELLDRLIQPEGWHRLRELVWERDGPYCQVCGLKIPKAVYDCGHIVDRMAGGLDELDNLVVMDWYCNQRKPIHETKEAYEAWLKSGYWVTDWLSRLSDYMDQLRETLTKYAPELIETPREQLAIAASKEFRYGQLDSLGIAPDRDEWNRILENDEFPEWKEHN